MKKAVHHMKLSEVGVIEETFAMAPFHAVADIAKPYLAPAH